MSSIRHALIRGVGERRVEVNAARRDAALHGVDEIGERPAADAVLGVGRDVGHVELAERRVERQAAAELQLVVAGRARRGVAGLAAARPEHPLAVGEVRRVVGYLARRRSCAAW